MVTIKISCYYYRFGGGGQGVGDQRGDGRGGRGRGGGGRGAGGQGGFSRDGRSREGADGSGFGHGSREGYAGIGSSYPNGGVHNGSRRYADVVSDSRVGVFSRGSLNINGTRPTTTGGLTGVQRVLDFFVAGCELDTTPRIISDHCSDNGVSVKNCESLNTRSERYTCFKLSIDADDKETVLNSNFWPRGVFLRNYYKPRSNRL